MFGIAGIISLAVLRRALNYVFEDTGSPQPGTAADEPPAKLQENRPRTPRGNGENDRAKTIFRVWLVVYGVVGAQMAWVLRPFIGSPDLPFEVFRQRESNVLENLLRTIAELFS